MGFGLLTFGFFLLVNITFYRFTDLVAGMLILLALTKLSPYSNRLKIASYITVGFCLFGLLELCTGMLDLFASAGALTDFMGALLPLRFAFLLAVTIPTLLGIRAIAKEVKLDRLTVRIDCIFIVPIFAHLLMLLISIEPLLLAMGEELGRAMTLISLLLYLVSVALMISVCYTAYMRICMPEDLDMPVRPSRFGFINEMRRRREERDLARAKERFEQHQRIVKEKDKKRR